MRMLQVASTARDDCRAWVDLLLVIVRRLIF